MTRGVFNMCIGAAALIGCCFTLSACSNDVSIEQANAADGIFSLSADPSLFKPPTGEHYNLRGEIKSASLRSQNTPIDTIPAHASGNVTVSDGIMQSAEIIAVIDSVHHLKFELTEPAVFERQGEVSNKIIGVGTLTTDSATYPEVKVLLEPKKNAENVAITASIEIPDALQLQITPDSEPVELTLTLEKAVN